MNVIMFLVSWGILVFFASFGVINIWDVVTLGIGTYFIVYLTSLINNRLFRKRITNSLLKKIESLANIKEQISFDDYPNWEFYPYI